MCLRDIRFGWSLIKELNMNLSDTLNFIKVLPMHPKDKNHKWLSTGIYISSLRDLTMVPIKSEMMKLILRKTSVVRDIAPKIEFRR